VYRAQELVNNEVEAREQHQAVNGEFRGASGEEKVAQVSQVGEVAQVGEVSKFQGFRVSRLKSSKSDKQKTASP
jgi:hypothetical protein